MRQIRLGIALLLTCTLVSSSVALDYKRKKKVVAAGGFTQLASDDFTRANGGLGANWGTVLGQGTLDLVSNAVQVTSLSTDSAQRYTAVTWPNDQYAEVTLITLNTANAGAGPAVRISPTTQTFYRITVKGPFGTGAVGRIEKMDASAVYSNLTGNQTITFAANDVVRLSVTTSGANAVLTGTRNGTTVLGPFTDTTNVIASGQAGLVAFVDSGVATDAVIDSWKGGSIP